MFDVREIDGAIAELENSELTMPRVEKLAALYTVKNQHSDKPLPEPVRYYAAAEPERRAVRGDSDFLRAVSAVDIDDALNVMDELMSALYVANQKAYNGVMRNLERLQ